MWEAKAKDNPDEPLPTTQTRRKKVDSTDVIGRMLGFVFIAIWVTSPFWIPRVYNSAKRNLDIFGWIPHSHDTPIWIGGEWLTGEYRICEMPGYPWGGLPESGPFAVQQRRSTSRRRRLACWIPRESLLR